MLTKTVSGYAGTTPISSTTNYTYNANGQLTQINGPRTDVSDIITLAYYANVSGNGLNRGQLNTVTNPLGHVITFNQYNAFGKPQQIVDENNVTTTNTYNTAGRLISETTAGVTTTYSYDNVGSLTSIQLPGNRTITYTYTTANLLASVADSLGNKIIYTYDSEGNRTVEEVRDPSNVLTKFINYTYDDYNRLLSTIYPDNSFDERLYDAKGNLAQVTDPASNITTFAYDALDRMTAQTQPGSVVTAYGYNNSDHLVSVTDAENNTTGYTVDDFGNVRTTASPDSGSTVYDYDAAGNMTTKTDATGISSTYTYDALNRVTAIVYPNAAQNVTYIYDQGTNGIGRLTEIIDQSGSTVYAYDSFGRLTQETKNIDIINYTTSYAYNQSGLLTSVTYPGNYTVHYNLDAAGQVQSVTLTNPNNVTVPLASNVNHMPFGPLKGMTYGNSSVVSRSFDQNYQMTGISNGNVLDVSFSHDDLGNITGIADNLDPAKDKTYTYDSLYRLTGATGPFGSLTYAYDNIGNRLSKTSDVPTSETYEYVSGSNRLGKITGSRTNIFAYDASGKVTVVAGDISSYTADANYVKNAANQRVKKTANGVTTVYHYDTSGNLIAETAGNGVLQRAYVYINGLRLATVEVQAGVGENIYYHHNDHLGTPQKLTNAAGTVVWSADYRPFGEANVTVQTVTNNFRFPGQYYDSETDLHYNWHRYYDPSTGRYLTPDPIGLDGGDVNLYSYVWQDPINWVDPSGLTGVIPFNPGISSGLGAGAAGSSGAGVLTPGQWQDMKEALSYLSPKPLIDSVCEFAKKSEKEKASDVPSWAEGEKPKPGESGKDFADRLLSDKYGKGKYPKGPGSEHNKIKKYGDRSRK